MCWRRERYYRIKDRGGSNKEVCPSIPQGDRMLNELSCQCRMVLNPTAVLLPVNSNF